MKKHIQLIITLLLVACSMQAQVIQKGKVVLQNSGYKALPGAQVTTYGAQPTDTDNDGLFRLNFAKTEYGELAPLKEAYKKGYELVNKKELENWILSDTKDMLIVMCPEGKLKEAREKYYNIGNSTYIRRYEEMLAQIEKQKESNQLTENEYADKLEEAYNELSTSQKILLEYSDIFSRINKDDLTDLERKAFLLLEDGKLDEAIRLYEDERLLEKFQQQLNIKEISKNDINEMIPSLKRYAEICVYAGGKENVDKASGIYKIIADSDAHNYQNLYEYACFVKKQIDYTLSITWLKKALKCAATKKEIADVYNELGDSYYKNKDFKEAEYYFKKARSVFENLSQQNSLYYFLNLSDSYLKLGELYALENKYKKSAEFIGIAYKKNEMYPSKDEVLYLHNKARALLLDAYVMQQKYLYTMKVDTLLIKQYYDEALIICDILLKNDSVAYRDLYSSALNNLSSYNTLITKDYAEAEKYLLESLKIESDRYIKNPYIALPELAVVYGNLSSVYENDSINKKLEYDYLMKSFELRNTLSDLNPKAYQATLIRAYSDIGLYFYEEDQYEDALSFFDKSNQIINESPYHGKEVHFFEFLVNNIYIANTYYKRAENKNAENKYIYIENLIKEQKNIDCTTAEIMLYLQMCKFYKENNNLAWKKYYKKACSKMVPMMTTNIFSRFFYGMVLSIFKEQMLEELLDYDI